MSHTYNLCILRFHVNLCIEVWRDLKSISSKKASKLRAARQRTGNFPVNETPLQNMELRVVSAIGLDYVEGNADCPDSCVEEDVRIYMFYVFF